MGSGTSPARVRLVAPETYGPFGLGLTVIGFLRVIASFLSAVMHEGVTMCGLVLTFAYHSAAQPVNRSELRLIRDAMAPRGPDGKGEWFSSDGRVGMGHRRLAIIDLSEQGAQPMTNRDGSLRLIFNGEIYNYQSLKRQLLAQGHIFHSTSDAEVLLHLYEAKGEAMLQELRGMFAFALWDDNCSGLLLARDPFGMKPLYYADDGKTLRVASQVKALLHSSGLDLTPEAAAHVGFFLWGYVPEPYSFYRGIKALPAGTAMWCDMRGQRRQHRYCDISSIMAQADAEASEMTLREQQARLGEALRDTVRHHLIADVPVGVFLSAGIDSTTLTALATEAEAHPLRTTTLGFGEYADTPLDEVPLAQLVAQYYQTEHSTVWISQSDFANEREQILTAMDQPTTDGINTYFVSQAAASANLKVALSGVGGDELFGGYPSFQQIPRLVKPCSLLPGCSWWGKGFRLVSAPLLKQLTSPKVASLFEYGATLDGAYLLRRSLFLPWELPDFIDRDLVHQGWADLQPLVRLEETTRDMCSNHLRISALELSWYMRGQLLRDADWAGMAHSLEIRTPLVDVDLLRQVVLCRKPPLTKRHLAHATKNPLPHAVLSRPKTGFAVPIHTWLGAKSNGCRPERGLRGWAKTVYAAHQNQ